MLIPKKELIGHIKAGIEERKAKGLEVSQESHELLKDAESHPNSNIYIKLNHDTRTISIVG